MSHGRILGAAATVGLAMVICTAAFAASGGINGHSGNPGDGGQICTVCHDGGQAPTVTLSGPTTVLPNTITPYTLTIEGGQEVVGGFDASASGGTVLVAEAGTQLLFGDVTHTEPRLVDAEGRVVFVFNWRSPATPGTFVLYGAGLSGDDAGGPNGDLADSDSFAVDVLSATATPGEASGPSVAPLLVSLVDATSGELAVTYGPACASTDHNLYYGPIDQVAAYGWSGDVCDIGTSGSLGGFNPGPGSFFFVVVGHDGSDEGSYGSGLSGGATTERPPFVGNSCGQTQSLADPCD